MNSIIHSILLQGKFFLVEWLNVTYTLIANPLRKLYLRIFGIKMGGQLPPPRMQVLSCGQVNSRL